MNIKIEKYSHRKWRAECLDLPGMPPIGTGASEAEALVALFYRMRFDMGVDWFKHVKRGPIKINGKFWEEADGMGER